MRIIQLIVLCVLSACRAQPYGEFAQQARVGNVEVHAETYDILSKVALGVKRAMPWVQTLPEARKCDTVLIYACSRQQRGGRGTNNEDFIVLRLNPTLSNAEIEYVVAHELTHHHFSEGWSVLPAIIEEGVCELIAEQAVIEEAAQRHVEHAVLLATAIRGGLTVDLSMPCVPGVIPQPWTFTADLERSTLPKVRESLLLSREELFVLKPDSHGEMLTALGYLLASRIGLSTLKQVCDEAHAKGWAIVPPERIFELAHMDGRAPKSWMPFIRALIGPEELEVLEHWQCDPPPETIGQPAAH